MKKALKLVLVTFVAAALLTACGKPPVEEVNLTKAALDAAMSEGAAEYTPEDLKVVSDKMEAVMAEMKVQEGKFFKSYDEVKVQLAAVKSDAEALKVKVAQRKEELKNAAIVSLTEAQAAVEEAKQLLENAPKGKGSLADIEAMKNDVAGLEVEMAGIQSQIDAGDFVAATEKAHAISGQVLAISADIKSAQEKLASLTK